MNEAQELVKYIVTAITGDADCFHITTSIDERGGLISLSVDKEQAGRVIGKKGVTSTAIRTLLHALGTKNNARYSLKIDDWDHTNE